VAWLLELPAFLLKLMVIEGLP